MHYYQFNIGDYAKSTKHLTLFEDLAYRRLLDLAYDTEKPLPKEIDKLTRLIGMREQKTETQQVLEEFFFLTKNGYIQKRVKRELDAYSAKAVVARANGKKGGRPPKTQQKPSGLDIGTQIKAKQEPLTNNHKPITINQLEIGSCKNKPTTELALVAEASPPSATKKINGTRLPKDFQLPAEWGNWALQQGLSKEQVISEAEIFRDHWVSTTKNATKHDWQATWRNWIRRNNKNKQKSFKQQDQERADAEALKFYTGQDEF